MGAITRREFVSRSARVAAAAAVASQMEWLAACGATGKGPTEADWEKLARRLKGSLVRPGERSYAQLRIPSNLRYADVRPGGIAVCAGAEDVRESILWARDHGIPAVARAGGHSYSGYSVTPGLLVDVSGLTAVRVNDRAETATVAPGARNTHIYDALQPHGVAFSAGRCPTVAVSGLTLGGGFGFSSRKVGLSADDLIETEIVTADGDILTCSARENPDLFWACRGGGGGNFGINTSFTFRTHPVDYVTLYDLIWDWKDAATAVAALQDVVGEAPDEWSMRIGLGASGPSGRTRATVGTLGQFFGPREELLAILDPVLSAAKPKTQLIARRTFWQAKTFFFDTTPAGRYAVKSNYVVEPLSGDAIDILTRAAERWPGSSNAGGGGIALFAWGGAMGRVAPDATAFVHRDAKFLMAYDTSWGPGDGPHVVSANLEWLDHLAADIRPHVSVQAYQNFIDRTLRNWQQAYYGSNFDRLVRIKRKVDPDNFFHFHQSIPTHA